MKYQVLALLIVLPFLVFSQNNNDQQLSIAKKMKLQPIVKLQFWGSYTDNQEIFDPTTATYSAVDDRLNFQLRRSRLGVKGELAPQLVFNFTSAYDLIGKDLLTATQGGGNNGSSPAIRLWNAYVQWQIKEGSQVWNLTAGYFTPRIGRESMTSPFASGSMEKAWSQNYLRRHLVGIGPGRATGLNLGGLIIEEGKNINWGYEIGVFTPNYTAFSGNSAGRVASPLFVGRLSLILGDAESNKYQLSLKSNQFGKRKGLTIGVSGAMQGNTDLFEASYTTTFDWMFNWKALNIDGDWSLLQRKGHSNIETTLFSSNSQTGYLRASYNIPLKDYIVEPSIMLVHFQGAETKKGIENALLVNDFAGLDQSLEIGINLHLSSKINLNIHYTANKGSSGDADQGAIFNNYLYQKEIGAIHRGNWLGVGLLAGY